MAICLFTVEKICKTSQGLMLLPGFKLDDPRPEVRALIQGTSLDLRKPDGTHHITQLVNYGISVTKDDQENVILHGDLNDQFVHVMISGEIEIDEIPSGTEIWID